MINYEEYRLHNDAKKVASRMLYDAAKKTWENRKGKLGEVIIPFDDFSGFRAIDVSNLPKGTLLNVGLDGVGTKIEVAERMNDYRTIAFDLFAMVVDDRVVGGTEPVLVGSDLSTNLLSGKKGFYFEQLKQLTEGYVNAARESNVAVINGECAELGIRVGGYGKFNSNWSAVAIGFANRDRIITGKEIREGDSLVGLEEKGFRSNGFSLITKILSESLGDSWHEKRFGNSSNNYGQLVMTPSRIYTRAVVDMFGGYDGIPRTQLSGVAHITGGGIPEKLGRMLRPSGLSARLDSLIAPSPIVKQVQMLGDVSDIESYKNWCMGNGMILATREVDEVVEIAKEYGIYAKRIGEVVKSDKQPNIIIEPHSSGPKTRLEFRRKD